MAQAAMAEVGVTVKTKKGLLPAIGLFLLAPLVAEFLLGNLPIKLLPALIVLAPMYGGGALLIRELVRRAGRGWPSIVLLGLAYGIVEEGFATQSLFNPDYLHLNMHLLQPAYIPALHMGGWWTIFVLSLHTIWSVSASIGLAEAAVPDRAETPWLGPVGFTVAAVLFAVGIVATAMMSYKHDHFVSLPGQFAGAAVACVLLVVAAFRLPRHSSAIREGWVPNPWLAGVIALAACSAILITPPRWGWAAAAIIPVLELRLGAEVLRWSQRAGWDLRHKLALAAGAALAYGWHAFVEKPVVSGSLLPVRVGNGVFLTAAIGLIWFAWRRVGLFVVSSPDALKDTAWR